MLLKEEKFTILLVDDREENLVSLEHILEGENRNIIKAHSGAEALKILLKTEEDIGLIMLDVQMPGMDGFEVAELVKANPKTRDISIIFVTAISKEQKNVLRGYDHGAVDYLQKPLDVAITQSKVRVFEQLYFYQRQLKDTIAAKDTINKQLERFMYVVAHDLKSPLNGVMSMLQILREDERIADIDDLREYMGLMIDASTHLSEMIASILEYSRKNHTEHTPEMVDVDAMVKEQARLLFPPKHIRIAFDNQLPAIKTKKLKLLQVFQNLLTNAIKYNDKKDGLIQVGYTDDGDFYKFYVKDNGQGIPEQEQARIFQLFTTTNNKSSADSSTGVGLNILRMAVEEQGGKISLDSKPGDGSTFYFQWRKSA